MLLGAVNASRLELTKRHGPETESSGAKQGGKVDL
jgi:hypothetical protein